MKTKTMSVQLKAIDLEAGQFEGYAAVFGNKDSYGDIIVPGAFADTLAEDYGTEGKGIPTYWCHDFKDPFKNIGSTLWAVEDAKGLRVRVQLDTDTQFATQTLKLLKEGRVNQMSFGYSVLEGAFVESEENGYYYELRKLKLHEVSVVPIGANQETEILAAKADPEDAPGQLELIRGAFLQLAGAVKALGIELPAEAAGEAESTSDSGQEPAEAKSEEPETAKGEEPAEAKSRTAEEDDALQVIRRLTGHTATTEGAHE
jgi:HK97 family phage prohead protease